MKNFEVPVVPCQIKELNLSCFGCCGRDFKSREEVDRDLNIIKKSFDKVKPKSGFRMVSFRDRFSPDPDDVMDSGICSNVVKFDSGCIACPLHPLINKLVEKKEYKFPFKKNRDPRINYCDENYECLTFKYYKHFSFKQKKEFVSWVKSNNYDYYSYSKENGEDKLIIKFMEENNYSLK